VKPQKLSALVAFILLLFLSASCSDDPSEGSASDFCKKLQVLAGPDSALTNLTLDNSQLVNQTIADLLELASEAPSSISNETQAVASLYEDILSKIVSVSPSQRTTELRKFQDELDEITTSARALELYGETECGLQFISPFETSNTPVPQVTED
tara:strand:- start:3233 stop:3694 length:462 start_codon:yes stop_codon:yes gene_type:complete